MHKLYDTDINWNVHFPKTEWFKLQCKLDVFGITEEIEDCKYCCYKYGNRQSIIFIYNVNRHSIFRLSN